MLKPFDPNRRSSTWKTFLKNHLDCSWAMDFFTVPTLTFKILYVFLIFDHDRRKVIHFASSFNPTLQWVIQQIREATPFGRQPKYLFHDNDGIFGLGLDHFLRRCGIKPVRTAYRSPWQNPFVERFIGTLRRELLDHVIILSQRHLDRLLAEFIEDYYHIGRPHQGLGGQTPIPQPRAPSGKTRIVSVPVLSGLHHRYYRAVA
ncbi:MAG: transposase [Planctomycetes bacterium]|nr:transposase [Planctomycetota bacterium]